MDTEVNHHQVESKGLRTPVEAPSSRYRARGFRIRDNTLNLVFNFAKSQKLLTKGRVGVFIAP